MNANLKALRAVGQSLWLDNITRRMLDDGTLERWIGEYGLTGLTSNPTIFDEAIGGGEDYDAGIRGHHHAGLSGEALFIELALEDLRRAARLFESAFEASDGVDGWVSMELSPLIADDTAASVDAAKRIHAQAACRNLFVKIPGTPAGVPAIEESIFEGVPINVTLLFSMPQYAAAADAYMRGIERRLEAGRDPVVASVASVFVSRWDKAIADTAPQALRNGLGIAVGMRCYQAYRDILDSDRWRRLEAAGARPQRLLWASTSTKDPSAPDTLYLEALAAPDTINTVPPKTLAAFADHGRVGAPMAADGGDAGACLQRYADAGIDVDGLATRLQEEGAASFVKSWRQLLQRIEAKTAALGG
ncbi:transaldolase [Luteimonas sp. 8-5]|uniref:transaldolase n=1 Tax=Luteimonas sp. 8-5 TaxID=3039387 RepID=UPI00243661AA|nr:transaldolase [Luteimonas sp. 8-5]MDG6349292.1 transaldolase [Luteimonas sp. 8-5]